MEDMKVKSNPLEPQYPVEYYGAKHLHKWMDDLTGRGNVYSMIRTLHNQKKDFPQTYKEYLAALEKYKEILGADAERKIKKLAVAIDMEYGEKLFWYGLQGLKMNYQHFVDPFAPNCTSADFNYADFPRAGEIDDLPVCRAAHRYLDQFRNSVPTEYEDVWDGILDYQVALEFDGMKLAHFYGYLAGNELLRHCVHGYSPDIMLTEKYRELIEQWFNCPVRTDEWEGVINLKDWIIAPIPMSDPQDDCVYREEIMKDASI